MSVHSSRAVLLAACLFSTASTLAADLSVPQQYGTIQAAIDAAQTGDTVLVAPGTYFENLSIGKSLSLRSTGGASDTTIDGQGVRVVIEVRGSGTERVVISGFTITNGHQADTFQSGGIYLDTVIAEISDNVIRNNSGCLGSGISSTTAALTIVRNRIADNPQDPTCSGAGGGGMFLNGDGAGPSLVANNIISGHTIGGGGAGIAANAVTRLTIRENLITDNHADSFVGGAILLSGKGVISGNVLTNNSAQSGGALGVLVNEDLPGIYVVSGNVMGQNQASLEGSAIVINTNIESAPQLVRNIIDGNSPVALIRCDGAAEFRLPASNRLRNTGGPKADGRCVLVGSQAP